MLCSTTSSEHYMPLDYTKPAPNPTSNSPNVGLPCPPPTAHHCYWDSGTIQLSSQLQWLSSKCEVGSVSFILPLHLWAPRPGKRGKFTPQWNVSKLRFQSSQTFRPSTSAAVLIMQLCGFGQKGENSERRMCQSPRIPMPKFSISRVSISHGLSFSKWQDLFSHLLEYFNHLWISIQTKLW